MSEIFRLDIKDFSRGLLVAVFGAVLTTLLQMIQNGFNGIDYKQIFQ